MKKTIITAIALLAVTAGVAQNRTVYIHMKSGEVKEMEYNEVDYIDFGDVVSYDLELNATEMVGVYYGGANYSFSISDVAITPNMLPTEAGQNILRLYVFAPESDDSNNAMLAAGRYPISDEIAIGNLYNSALSYTCLLQCVDMVDGEPQGYTLEFESGALNVEYEADGTANIVFRGKLADYGPEYSNLPKNIKVTYTGKLEFDNQDPNSYIVPTEDITMVPTGLSGGYDNVEGFYGNYSLSYYNLGLDEEGYIISAGELMNFELLTPEGATMDAASQLPGDYTITSSMEGPWEPYNFLDGTIYPGYGIPIGTYYSVYGEGGAETRVKGFAIGGTVHVDVEGENMTLKASLDLEGGHKLTMDYTAPLSSIAQRSYAPAQVKQASFKSAFKPAQSKNVRQSSVIKLIKK